MSAEFEKSVLVGEPVQMPNGDVLTVKEYPLSGSIDISCGGVGAFYSVDEVKLLGHGNRSLGINRIAETWYKATEDEPIIGGSKLLLGEIKRLQGTNT